IDGTDAHPLTIEPSDSTHFRAAQFCGAFGDEIEHRLWIGCCRRNYAKDFAGRGLSTSVVIQACEGRDIFGSERHALIPRRSMQQSPIEALLLPQPLSADIDYRISNCQAAVSGYGN